MCAGAKSPARGWPTPQGWPGVGGATGARFVNQAPGIFNRNAFGSGSIFYGLAADNFGTINVNSGFLSLRAGGNFTGSVNRTGGGSFGVFLESGTFNLAGAIGADALVGADGGTVNISAPLSFGFGGKLAIRGATTNLNVGASITGTGTVSVEGGSVNVNAPVSVADMDLSGGTVQGAGTLTAVGWSRRGGMLGWRRRLSPVKIQICLFLGSKFGRVFWSSLRPICD